MKESIKFFVVCIAVVTACMIIAFITTGYDLTIYKFWAPKQEKARREVFENTPSYVQGKIEYISKLRFEYEKADGPQKESLRSLIVSESSTVDLSNSPGLASFVHSIGGGR